MEEGVVGASLCGRSGFGWRCGGIGNGCFGIVGFRWCLCYWGEYGGGLEDWSVGVGDGFCWRFVVGDWCGEWRGASVRLECEIVGICCGGDGDGGCCGWSMEMVETSVVLRWDGVFGVWGECRSSVMEDFGRRGRVLWSGECGVVGRLENWGDLWRSGGWSGFLVRMF
ncbi:hypothetical protein Tco_1160825 [Tanacetum coccineum]